MNRRPLLPVIGLAVISIAGLAGMLVVDGPADALFLSLAALPLLAGAWRARTLRHAGRHRADHAPASQRKDT